MGKSVRVEGGERLELLGRDVDEFFGGEGNLSVKVGEVPVGISCKARSYEGQVSKKAEVVHLMNVVCVDGAVLEAETPAARGARLPGGRNEGEAPLLLTEGKNMGIVGNLELSRRVLQERGEGY